MEKSLTGKNGTQSTKRQEKPVTIPVVEEQVTISKKPIERARLRIEKRVVTENIERDILLHSTRVEVERVRCDRPVDEVPEIRVEGDTTIIPVVEEVVEVRKSLVLREELHIHKHREERTETVRTDVRREQVHIERIPMSQTHPKTTQEDSNE